MNRFFSLNRDLWLMYLSSLFWGFGLYFYFYLQPIYVTQLGATPAQVGLALGVGGFLVIFLYAPIGLWADRRGRKRVMIVGWSIGTLSALAMALAPDWRWFTPAMAGYLLSNFAVAVSNGYIATAAPPERRSEVFALVSSGSLLGSIIAPAIGGWIAAHFGLRATYFAATALYGLSTVTLFFLRDQPAQPTANRANAGLLLRRADFWWQIAYVFLVFFAVDVGQVLAPKFLEEVYGYTVAQIGQFGTVAALGSTVLMLTLSKLPGEGRWAMLGSLLLAWTGVALWSSSANLWVVGLAFLLVGGNRLVRPPALVMTTRLLDPATVSFGLGFQQMAMQLGLSVSPYVAGWLYERNAYWPFYAGLLALIVVSGITLFGRAASAAIR